MNYEYINGNVIIKSPVCFDLAQTFECGQCFRFGESSDGYLGVAHGRVLKLTRDYKSGDIILENVTEEEFGRIWYNFFSLDTDYKAISESLITDETIARAIGCASGIRLLRQELWECMISFIISQNNNIPRIKKIIEAICASCGSELEYNGIIYHAFPTPKQLSTLSQADLKALGCGYRDEYIYKFTRDVIDNKIDLELLKKLPTPLAREELLRIKGIGGKVADCILLFGMSRYEVCPHDVWVKRIFETHYGIQNVNEKKGYALAREKWGAYAGIAQQYLFYAEREQK